MTQSELYQLLVDTHEKVKQAEELELRELISEIIRMIESEYSQ
ncbi:hypothetical protein [Siminovitchia fordii]|uniref:Uncharacterized protein n=1 Tax=Siminovitchia fordii TaxID=254759 RepID=A0ABQ4K7X3_9BACI|nr:hypothetical protein [Siminovitchia fordii]GIN20938.1 hypothetical protein J1TS3_20720 [Siminovitchia fordii]